MSDIQTIDKTEPPFNSPVNGDFLQTSENYGFKDSSTILGLNAAFENLFEVSLMQSNDNPDLNDFPVRNIKGIKLPNLGFDLKRALLTRKFHTTPETLKYYSVINIDWMEDDEFSVITFHDKWKRHYYDEDKQRWVTGAKNKFVNLKIRISASSNDLISSNYSNTPPGTHLIIELRNVSIPSQLPKLELEYGKADPISYPLSYPVEKITGKVEVKIGSLPDTTRRGV